MGRQFPCDGCDGESAFAADFAESWNLFLMAATRERGKDGEGKEYEVFSVKWEFVNTYLTHAACGDPEQALRDLIDLERAMNAEDGRDGSPSRPQ